MLWRASLRAAEQPSQAHICAQKRNARALIASTSPRHRRHYNNNQYSGNVHSRMAHAAAELARANALCERHLVNVAVLRCAQMHETLARTRSHERTIAQSTTCVCVCTIRAFASVRANRTTSQQNKKSVTCVWSSFTEINCELNWS